MFVVFLYLVAKTFSSFMETI